MADEFFDDEQELMEAPAAPSSAQDESAREVEADAPTRPEAPAQEDRPAPPPFWMVLAIAVIALLLGVIIGYLLGSSAALASIEAQQEQLQAQATDTSDDYALPEGHPDVEVDEDGTAHVVDENASTDAQ